MYAGLELNKRARELPPNADKILKLAQRWYKKDCNRHFRFATIFCVGDYIFLSRPYFLRSATVGSVSEEYNELLTRNQGTYSVIKVVESTLRIVQDGLNNMNITHWDTFSRTLRRYCNEETSDDKERLSEDWHLLDR